MELKPAVDLIKRWEGCVLNAYWDKWGKVWTIGYGTTSGIKKGMKITKAQAESFLMEDIRNVRIPSIKRLVKVPINNNELCALISFCYNVGTGGLAKSQVLKRLNAGRPREEAAAALMNWVTSGGKVLPGLVSRRKSEKKLFLTPVNPEIRRL